MAGTSTPSLNRSTANTTFTSRSRSRRSASSRSAAAVRADTAAAGMPASVKRRAMYSACSMLTQNPSARMCRGSRTLSRTASSTLAVRMSSPV